jgi:uncharacterized damage-inducible protein DinB
LRGDPGLDTMGVFILMEVQMLELHTMPIRLAFSVVSACALIVSSPSSARAQQATAGKTYTLSGESLRGYQNVQSNLAAAAEKMPEEHYGFKPTPEIKPFGQHVAHIALSQYGLCSRLKGEPNPKKDEKEETTRSKTDAVALLKGSAAYCEPLVTGLTEASWTEMMSMGEDKVAKGLIPMALVAHGDEVYGTMAVYLRLKGIVPPSTEKMNQMKQEKQNKKSSQ